MPLWGEQDQCEVPDKDREPDVKWHGMMTLRPTTALIAAILIQALHPNIQTSMVF